jgi:sortase (surface protein transpeptidase)
MSGSRGISRAGLPRRTVIVIVLAVACVAAGAIAVWAGARGSAPPPRPSPAAAGRLPAPTMTVPGPSMSPSGHGSSPTTSPARTDPAAPPVALDIPAIKVHTRLLDLGLNQDGTLQVPGKPLQAGWFHGSPAPGRPGPAVILGHVDSYQTGPAVFYRLGAMRPHEQITVTRADRSKVVFSVDAVRAYAKASFPTLQVYGNTADPELRLITCSDWNSRTHSYDGNTVVFAHLTDH